MGMWASSGLGGENIQERNYSNKLSTSRHSYECSTIRPFRVFILTGDIGPEVPLEKQQRLVKRYFQKGDFNPRSKDQLLAYLESQGLEAGPNTGISQKPALDKKVLERLAKKSTVFQDILDLRAIQKVESTYVDNAINQLKRGPRLKYNFFHKPSTMRLSSGKPFNIQNVVGDR